MRWDFVSQWLAKAEEDLLVARVIVGADLPSYDAAGFHAQQAAEKALKALLVRHQVEFRHTHDIQELLARAEAVAAGISTHLTAAEALTPYAVDARYPGAPPALARDTVSREVEVAAAVLSYVRDRLRPYLDAGPPAG